jgi:hypothetical protein
MEEFEKTISVSFGHPFTRECNCDEICISNKMLNEKFAKSWMIEDNLSVSHQFGSSVFTVHFYPSKETIIYSFHKNRPNGSDMMDLRALVIFLMNKGWKRPSPISSEIDYAMDFWREAWETGLVDSDYLQKKFGKRKLF